MKMTYTSSARPKEEWGHHKKNVWRDSIHKQSRAPRKGLQQVYQMHAKSKIESLFEAREGVKNSSAWMPNHIRTNS